MATIPTQLTRRAAPGMVAPDYVQDPEARRVLQSQQWFQQWVIDNWPQPVEPLEQVVIAPQEAIPVPPVPPHTSSGGGGSAQPFFDKSIVSTAGIVTLSGDATTPGNSKVYGTNSSGTKGWFDAPGEDHDFKFTKTSTTGGSITAGLCMIDGIAKTITSLPATLTSVTTSIKYWVSVDKVAKTATWASHATTYATGSTTVDIFPILEITCADSVITSWIQRRASAIVLGSAFSTNSAFKFAQTSTTGGTITAGTCQIDGTLKTITSLPSTLTSVTSSIKYWISVDCLAKTATWASGAAYATGTKTVYIYPILEITCAGSVITGSIQRRNTDIVATSSIGVHDPTSKDTVGSTAEGSEAAEGTTKTFGSDSKGLTLYMTSRIGYYDAGDKTLWGYVRELRFDEGGHLYYVSGETRVSVAVLVAET